MENSYNPELLALMAERKMERLVAETELQQSVSGQLFEYLPLSGDISLRREMLTDGTTGAIEISYPVTSGLGFGICSWYEKVQINPMGEVKHSLGTVNHREGEPLSGFRRAILTVKLIKGKPDHWDRESDFYGTIDEYGE